MGKRPSNRAGDVTAIVPAAGAGRRAGTAGKLFRPLKGVPVVVHAVRRLSRVPAIGRIILVVRSRDLLRTRRLVRRYRLGKVARIVAGGPTRMASVQRGLDAVESSAPYVLIHDAARPLVTPRLAARVIRAARRCGAAIAAVPAADTMKRTLGDARTGHLTTLPRRELWAAQTPQVFRSRLIRGAYAQAARSRATPTDDAAAVERLGHRVAIVSGDATNLKITWPQDVRVASALLNGAG